jgi:2-oxoglutarate ferredoxin oxidoreductase subunit alpha
MGAYPMSPATSIMEEFDKEEGVLMKQAFDEIGAIGFALGASIAGVRSMTATSGGGLDLMGEFISLVGSSEQPLVIVDVQRPGAATGLPTRQGQSDLNLVLNIGHGDFPRVVLVPGDVEELYYETFNAFNIADKYQLPVLVLSDKHLASSVGSLSVFDDKGLAVDRGEIVLEDVENYKRFSVTKSGVSPRSIPGKGPVFNSSSDEHNEEGLIFEGADNKVVMEDKRFRKLDALKKELALPKLHGSKNAEITLVSFGSTKAAILEAVEDLKNESVNVNFLQLVCVCPFPSEYVQSVLSKSKKIICIEENKTGQLAGLIRRETGIEIKEKLLKYNGRAFFPSEIFDKVMGVYNEKV